jgi:hypothetical protein
MTDRYSNEIDHLNDAGSKPEPASHEQQVDPLITQDYGVSVELEYLARMIRSGVFVITATRKVDTGGRYVVEFQAVRRKGPRVKRPGKDQLSLPI